MNTFLTRIQTLTLAWMACATIVSHAQQECDGYRYRYTGAFETHSVTYDVQYGQNLSWNGVEEELVVDIYAPVGDVIAERPLVILAHGGFFLDGSNDGLDVVSLSEDLAQMGYVVASMSYRLGVDDLGILLGTAVLQDEFVKAVWRGVHDSKAAVRFFRKSAEEGNPYGIDANRIYLGGVSAGAFIALHHAYVDDDSEIPTQIDITELGLEGGLEGLSGNPGYSSAGEGRIQHCRRIADDRLPGFGRKRTLVQHPRNRRQHCALRRRHDFPHGLQHHRCGWQRGHS